MCEAGKFHKIRALDIYCEALDPDLYIKSSEYFVEQDGRQKVFSMENCTLFSGECSDLSKRRPIVEVVQKLRYTVGFACRFDTCWGTVPTFVSAHGWGRCTGGVSSFILVLSLFFI